MPGTPHVRKDPAQNMMQSQRRDTVPTRRNTLASGLSLLVFISLLSGCYAYVPTEFDQPAPGTMLRAVLTPVGEQDAITRFGPGVRQVEGIMLERDGAQVSVLVDAVNNPQGTLRVNAQPFRLEPRHVTTLQERRMSVGRSVLFGAGLVTGAFLLVESLGLVGRQLEPPEDDTPGPPQIRIPVSLPGGLFGRP
jgi:hypothetical protein